jgi:hypothetical protein
MCPPLLAIASFAIGAAGQVASFIGAQNSYKAQLEYKRQNDENAARAASIRYDQINQKAIQEGEAAADRKFEAAIDAKRAISTVRTAAGEGGVSGLSVAALMSDVEARHGRFKVNTNKQLQLTRSYLGGEKDAAQAQGQSQVNSVPTPEKPNFASTLIGIFGSGINSYNDYQRAIA